jgi:four helix bundle protein
MWQKAHAFVIQVYQYTEYFPRSEIYGLTAQFKRAAISIPANIAEGFRKRSKAETHRYLEIAHSSLEECQYYLILSQDLGYGETGELEKRLTEISRMLFVYKTALKKEP